MTLSSEALRSLDEQIRPYLISGRDTYFDLLLWATAIVLIGVVLEGFEVLHETKQELLSVRLARVLLRLKFKYRLKINPDTGTASSRINWKLLVAFVGWFLVSVGIVGELWFEIKVQEFDLVIREIDDSLLTQTESAAAHANERSLSIRVELEQERQKTARFQREADIARLALEKQIRNQGPRARILDESRSRLIEHLKPFSGQNFIAVVCGAPSFSDTEKIGFMNTLLDILATGKPINAGWKHDLQFDELCTYSPTVAVFINSNSPTSVRSAANTLAVELNSLFKAAPNTAMPLTPTAEGDAVARRFRIIGDRSVIVLVRTHPDSVVVSIGPHP